MVLIVFLLIVPIINLIILIAAFCCKSGKSDYKGNGPVIMSPENHSAPVEEGYKDDRDIADMIDGRLTNITKNPWKGVL